MRGGENVRRGGIAHRLVALAGGMAMVIACGDLQQAGTGGAVVDDDSTGAAETDAPMSTTGEPGDDGDGGGTQDGATVEPDTGLPEESSTGAALDDTSSTGDPSDGSTGDDGPLPGPHDGMYGGTFSAQFQVEGQFGSCMGPVLLTIDENAASQVTGTATCSVTIDIFTFDILATIEGSIASPTASGTMSATINGTPESTTWTGTFVVDTMDAAFAGDFPQGPYTVTYAGTWQATR